ncbi:MAG: glycosyltransferase family 2 protein [Rhodoplanes sp.]|jgi:glycosyltransferase involved in cell wall biosynthesis
MLTVVLPNFNHARFLPFAFEGILGQSRPANELIVIDDDSTDDSVAVIESYLRGHANARLVRNEKNQGVVRNMNAGLAMASGSLVFFAAADDITYPALFATATSLLNAYPQAALFSAKSDIIDGEGRSHGPFATPTPLKVPGFISPATAGRLLLRDDGWFMGNTTVFRRAPLLAAGGFTEELGAFADGYVSRLLALKQGACFSPSVLAAWRQTEGGVAWSQTISLEKTNKLIAAVERKMAADGVFPPGYAERWKRRHLFGALRFRLVQERRSAQALSRTLLHLVREQWLTAWWFATLRPWDVYAVLRRRLAWFVSHPRNTPPRSSG